MITIHPHFISKFLPDGSTSMVCRETGEVYSISSDNYLGDCYCYRSGELMTFGKRFVVLNAVESDARWSIRENEEKKLRLA